MKGKIVRVCGWFALIMFALTSLVGLGMIFTQEFNVSIILALLICLLLSATGWYARKFGLPGFRVHVFSKTVAAVSLIFGILLLTLVPILFAHSFGISDSWLAIRNLLILFLPVVVSAIAILTSKSSGLKENL
jgi:hypothetical protein